ncbi:MAG: WD40-repeat-containing domain protein [Piptocephalis tieghemiana]|nr:MAG: WD40-repeat-containing domain protein [Piptocephalis tieghemiana]
MTTRLQTVSAFQAHNERVWQVDWHPLTTTLASCSSDKTVRIHLPPQGNPHTREESWSQVAVLEGGHDRAIRAIAFSPDGRLASASFDGTIGIWEREGGEDTWECVASLEGHENEAKSVAWSAGGNLLATCSRDKSVWIWEATEDNDFDCLSVLQEHRGDVKMVAWHPRSEVLVSTSYDDSLRFWREESDDWTCYQTIESAHDSTIWAVSFSPNGKEMATVSDDKSLRIWKEDTSSRAASAMSDGYGDPSSLPPKWILQQTLDGVHTRSIYSVSWSAKGDYIATGGGDNRICLFGRREGLEFEKLSHINEAHGVTDVNVVKWCPNQGSEDILVSGGDDGYIRIWSLVNNSEAQEDQVMQED